LITVSYPPSQYQLHLQFIVLPLLPFQYEQYLRGVHCTQGRFFPLQYVRAVLALDAPMHVVDDTPIEAITAFYKARGVDYDIVHRQMYDQIGENHRRLANWQIDQFSAVVVSNVSLSSVCSLWCATLTDVTQGPGTPATVLDRATMQPRTGGAAAAAIRDNDKLILRMQRCWCVLRATQEILTAENYGRPYTAENKPTGTYYSMAKQSVHDMVSF
jgi:hypothetical protein